MAQLVDLMKESEFKDLDTHECVISRGLKTFLEVGTALSAIRDGKLYRNSYPTFEKYCAERWGMTRCRSYQLMEAAQAVDNLSTIVDKLPATESQARPLTRLEPAQQVEAWTEAVKTAPEGKVTAAHVAKVVERYQAPAPVKQPAPEPAPVNVRAEAFMRKLEDDPPLKTNWTESPRVEPEQRSEPKPEPMAVHYSSASPEWYTPRNIVDASLAVLGTIDCDPCSNSKKSPNVPAAVHYTKDDDGLTKIWEGTVFLNPPYGNEIIDWVERLVGLYKSGVVSSAIALLPARTDTQWFGLLCSGKPALCFVRGRLKDNPDQLPSMVAYLGTNYGLFSRFFSPIGLIFSSLNVEVRSGR